MSANGKDYESGNYLGHRDQLLTIGDLDEFKNELITEMKNAMKDIKGQLPHQWLRSSEVRKLLGVSSGTLQNFRINRVLSFSKIGGIVFYRYDEIIKVLENNTCPKIEQRNG